MGTIDEQLFGYATPDDAGAADPVLLRYPDLGAMTRGDARRAHAARTRTDYKQIKVKLGHGMLLTLDG